MHCALHSVHSVHSVQCICTNYSVVYSKVNIDQCRCVVHIVYRTLTPVRPRLGQWAIGYVTGDGNILQTIPQVQDSKTLHTV